MPVHLFSTYHLLRCAILSIYSCCCCLLLLCPSEQVSRMEAGDHWIVYGQVDAGKVTNDTELTAVHHRKVGNHY